MPPSLYHYLPVPMAKAEKPEGCSRRKLFWAGLVVMFLLLVGTMVYFAVQANSKACHYGLREEEEWRNTTRHLQDQLTRAEEALRDAHATCNSTVTNLAASLSQMKTQKQKLQEQVQSLKNEITRLNEQLLEARKTERQLRNEISAFRQMNHKNAASGWTVTVGPVSVTLLLLVLAALCF